MSLIFGLNLPTRLFLVADTRITSITNGKEKSYKDNFWKAFSFGKKISCVVAGNALLASRILHKINEANLPKDNINLFRKSLEQFLPTMIDQYLQEGGKCEMAAFIFGGYDITKKKSVNSSTFGDVQSRGIVGKKGVAHQAINTKMVEGLLRAALLAGGSVAKDTEIEIDAPDSSIFSVVIDLPKSSIFKDIPCYSMALFGQKGLNEKYVPLDVIQKLEVDANTGLKGDAVLYRWSIELATLVDTMIDIYSLDAVGGDILTMFLTPNGAVVPTGLISKIDTKTEKIVRVSNIVVAGGKFCTRNTDGRTIPYDQIFEFGNGNASLCC